VRSLVASCYSREGGSSFDPASMFCLYLCKFLDGFRYMDDFVSCLHDKDKGRCYRVYAGISYERVPCEADFSNFKISLEKSYPTMGRFSPLMPNTEVAIMQPKIVHVSP